MSTAGWRRTMRQRELLLFEDQCELSSEGVFTWEGLRETDNKRRPLSEAAREHMFASLCRNRSSRTLLLPLLPTLFLYVAWSSSRFRRRGESSFTMCIFTHETRTNQLDIKWDAAITAIQHLGIFIDFDWCSDAWWWKEKVHSVDISRFFCRSDFTWRQSWWI